MSVPADPPSGGGRAVPPQADPATALRAALRTARVEEAERARAIADLQGLELARLEMLRDHLAPLLAALPPGTDLFDVAIAPAPHPRLFIDMIGFVEMAADRRQYRLVQDTREGRRVLHEGEALEGAAEAVTAYVARRLVEREKMLASAPASAGSGVRSARLASVGRLLLQNLGVAALVVLLWELGHALFRWAVRL